MLCRSKDYWCFADTKTKRSRRNIPLQTNIIRILTEHRLRQNEERLKLGTEFNQNDLVFTTQDGNPLMHRNTVRAFKCLLKLAGLLESIRLYDLRHTCATLMLLNDNVSPGINPKIVSERLGHTNISLTLDVYTHLLLGMQEGASAKLDRLLFSFKAAAKNEEVR